MRVTGRSAFAAQARWALFALALAGAAGGWYAVEAARTGRLPGGGSGVGLALGVAGAALILFEMLLWPRKRLFKLRTRRLGRTQTWMKAHIWLGLLCVPVAVLHAGFRLGGPLAAALMGVFAAVILSGVWGLWKQQTIPRRMLELVPDEVPAAEIERIVAHHTGQFERRLRVARGGLGGDPLPGSAEVEKVFVTVARPYLAGEARPAELAVPVRAGRFFAALAAALPDPARPLVADLEDACRLRRQLDEQARLHRQLHAWVWVHLPLSVLLVGLLAAHIVVALRYI